MVNFSTDDTESNQLKIVNEVTEKEGAEGDAVEIGVRFQWKCVHPTKEQSQESDDNRRSTGEMSEEDEQDAAILPNRLGDVVEDRRKAERFENCFHLGILLSRIRPISRTKNLNEWSLSLFPTLHRPQHLRNEKDEVDHDQYRSHHKGSRFYTWLVVSVDNPSIDSIDKG